MISKKKKKINKYANGGWQDNWKEDKILGSSLGMTAGVASLLTSAITSANPDTESIDKKADIEVDKLRNGLIIPQLKSFDDLMAQQSSYSRLIPNAKAEDYYNEPTNGQMFTGALKGAISGATTGATAGPWGAVAGTIIGAGSNLIGNTIGKNKAQSVAQNVANKINAEE
jgi:hypothetical protein